jgi:hypothetical protein
MNGQTYKNHRHRPTMWLVAVLLSVCGFVLALAPAVLRPAVVTIGPLLVSLALVLTVLMVRRYALALQNRIIRLEMQTRLVRLNRAADLDRLSMPQVVALRFASDAELPGLIDKAVTERLSPDQIKRAVTNWQGDYLRT